MESEVLTEGQINELLAVNDTEIYSLLGAAVLSTVGPVDLLNTGREGRLYSSAPPVLGPEVPFEHAGLEKIARGFLCKWAGFNWGGYFRENAILTQDERSRGRREVDVVIATVVASITVHIPQLATYSVLLNILGGTPGVPLKVTTPA